MTTQPLNQREDVQAWLEIAAGSACIPDEFQRMIAAWEVIVAWHRHHYPGEQDSDRADPSRGLIGRLSAALALLQLQDDDEWKQLTAKLLALCPVTVMKGAVSSKEVRTFTSSSDWRQLVGTLYTVRCNVLKAGKSPLDPRDIKVCAGAAAVTTYAARRLVAAGQSTESGTVTPLG